MRYKANFPVYEKRELQDLPDDTEVMLYHDVINELRKIIKAGERLEFDGMEYDLTKNQQSAEKE